MNPGLAIVIPAFKSEYLEDCLESIARQTNKDFTLYIGNDASPFEIETIVDQFRDRINIRYKRFRENLGSVSLVRHWERCITMIGDEDWIWLFSDDDMMDPDCVARSLKAIKDKPDHHVFRFNLEIIDENGNIERKTFYPEEENKECFLMKRFALKYDSAITNHIFSRKVYNESGFQEFPLAWCSDDASIVNFANEHSIITIPVSKVQWRLSNLNISSIGDSAIQKQKVYSRLAYLRWVYNSNKFPVVSLNKNKDVILKWMVGSIENEFTGFSQREKMYLFRETQKITGRSVNIYRFKSFCLKMFYRTQVILSSVKRKIERVGS